MGGIFGGFLAISDMEWCVMVGDKFLHPKKAAERLSSERFDYLFRDCAKKAANSYIKKKKPTEAVCVVCYDRAGTEIKRYPYPKQH